MWPEDQWPLDIGRMKSIGFNVVRLFEFAWHRFEPEEGRFDFGWAHRILDLCREAGLRVIVGTPTAAPPAWLSARYPEILRIDASFVRAKHGQRKHYSVYNKRYRLDCARIVGAMAESLSSHPSVIGWQIDNEMDGLDFSAEAHNGFRDFLKRRFGTIDALNRAWGLEFWSQAYSQFDQVSLPPVSFGGPEIPDRWHPSLVMAAAQFNNEAWSSFIECQSEIIRRHSSQPVSTNMTPSHQMDWFAHNKLLDRVGLSTYRDLEHYPWTLASFDRMRVEKEAPFWILETAPSWSAAGRIWNIHHSNEGVRAFSWLTLLCGADTLLYWHWRQHWSGQEMLHGVLVNSVGRWSTTAKTLGQFARDAAAQSDWLARHPPAPAELAIMLSPQSAWAFSIDPTDDEMRYDVRWRDDHYLPLANHHFWRDVVGPDAEISEYQVLLLPLMPIIPVYLRDRLRDWVQEGGALILGPMSGNRSEQMTAFTNREFGGLEDLIGAECAMEFSVKWVEQQVSLELKSGRKLSVMGLCTAYVPGTAKELANYVGGYAHGLPGIVQNKFGKGEVVTIGSRLEPDVYLDLIKSVLDSKGIQPIATASAGLAVVPRADRNGKIVAYGIVNLTEREESIRLAHASVDRFTGTVLPATFRLEPLQVVIAEINKS